MSSSARVPNVGTGALTMVASGSRRCASCARAVSAFARAANRSTLLAGPNPASRLRPSGALYRSDQRWLPSLVIRSANPRPSLCRPTFLLLMS